MRCSFLAKIIIGRGISMIIPVLCWVEVSSLWHACRPHGCMHDNGKVYIPVWARGKEAMSKEAELRAERLI